MYPDHEVVRHVLPNGLTLLVRTDRTAPVVAIVTWVRAGYFDETDDVSGIAHVLEHMYFKGTPTRGVGEIAKQTKASGGYLNASTIYDHTRYYAVLPSSGFAAGLEIQADAWANSQIDADELRRELEVIIEEARRKLDTPEAVTTETLLALMHDRHRIRRWRIGHEAGLRALGRDQLMAFYRNFYVPGNTIMAIVGDIDAETAIRQVEARYGGAGGPAPIRNAGDDEVAPSGQRYREQAGGIAHTHGAFGWRTPGVTDDASPHLDLAAMVLSTGRASRLYRAVRETGLATSLSAWNYTPGALGVFVVQWSGEPATQDEAARAVWREVAALGDLDQVELERAQRLLAARWLRRLESMEGQANYLVDWESLGGVSLGNDYAARVARATVRDVRAAVRAHLDPSQASFMLYRPEAAPAFAADTATAFAKVTSGQPAPLAPLPALHVGRSIPHAAVRLETVEQGVHVYRTATGTPILVLPRPGAPIVHLAVYANGGASREAEGQDGLSTLMVRTALKGTATRGAEATSLQAEWLGGSISASASSDGMGWGFSVPAASLEPAVDLLADVVLQPAFGAEALDVERKAALAALVQLQDDMYRYPSRLATAAAFAGHPYARSAAGSPEGLAHATTAALREWHRSQVLAGEVTVALVGDVVPQEAASLLAGAFAALEYHPCPSLGAPGWVHPGASRIESRARAQSALVLMWPGPARRDADRHAAQLLSIIVSGLGGRFFEELRDRQSLAYTVHASPVLRAVAGTWSAYIATSPDKEERAREGLLREFERLRESPVTGEELARARTYALGTQAIAQQSAGHVLNEAVDAWVHGTGLAELGSYEAAIRAVTAADLQQLAIRYFDPAARVEGVVRGGGR